jgi:hypothetical protein
MEHAAASGPEWLSAVELSVVGQAMRQSTWLYPLVETAHILGFVILVGTIMLFDLRLLEFGRSLPIDRLAGFVLPIPAFGCLLTLVTGSLLFVSEATAYARNPLFLVKIGLIALGLFNVLYFHLGPYRTIDLWHPGKPVPPAARLSGLLSLTLWFAVIISGRLIAYV